MPDLAGIIGGAPLPFTDREEGVRSGSLGGRTLGRGGAIWLDGGDIDGLDAAAREGTGGGGGLRCVEFRTGEEGTGGGGTLPGL